MTPPEPTPSPRLPHKGKWRVALLGAGYIADWHAKAIRQSRRRLSLVAVCDRVRARAEAAAATHRIPHVFDSLDALLASNEVDAVHVLLPPEHHFAAAAQILRAGRHALLEKPMCLTADECQQLVDLAAANNCRVGVGHNFLFAGSYQHLRADLRDGRLGRPDHVTINWHRELPQVGAGPFDSWLLRDPRNVMLEIGPHVAAHVLDLIGEPDTLSAHASDPTTLASGQIFYRRWQIHAARGRTAIDVNCSFITGFDDVSIHVRGTLAGATCDVGRNTYVRRAHTASGDDLDRRAMIRAEAKALTHQANRNFRRYALSKFKLSKRGSTYGDGIRSAIAAFYDALDTTTPEPRTSGTLGRDIIALCQRIITASGVTPLPIAPPAAKPADLSVGPAPTPKILVLGATGFIGKELVRQLLASNHPTRVLVRGRGKLPPDLQSSLDILDGDASNAADLDRALAGITHVYHLARPVVKTWADYQKYDIDVTRLIAERCLAAGVKRLIYTGTIDSYYAGIKAGLITEDTPLDPKADRRNLYARSKAHCERLLEEMRTTRKLPVVIARPGIVIGRGGSPFHWGVGMWHHNAVCRVWGNGTNPLPLVLVEDVAAGLVKLLDAPDSAGHSFNFVADPVLSARDYLAELERAANIKLDIRYTPVRSFYLADMAKWLVKTLVRHPERRRPSYRDWESRTQRATFNCSKTRQALDWHPTSDRAALIQRGIVEPTLEAIA